MNKRNPVDEMLIRDMMDEPVCISKNIMWLYDNRFIKESENPTLFKFSRQFSYKSVKCTVKVLLYITDGKCTGGVGKFSGGAMSTISQRNREIEREIQKIREDNPNFSLKSLPLIEKKILDFKVASESDFMVDGLDAEEVVWNALAEAIWFIEKCRELEKEIYEWERETPSMK